MANKIRLNGIGGGLVLFCAFTGAVAGVLFLLPHSVVAADSVWRDDVFQWAGFACLLAYLCGARAFTDA